MIVYLLAKLLTPNVWFLLLPQNQFYDSLDTIECPRIKVFFFSFGRRRQWHPTLVLLPGKSQPGRFQSLGSLRVGHDWATSLSLVTFMHWRRKWQPTPVFLPGESQGWGEPGRLLSMGFHRVRHDWNDLAAVEIVILSEISQRKISYVITYVQNL